VFGDPVRRATCNRQAYCIGVMTRSCRKSPAVNDVLNPVDITLLLRLTSTRTVSRQSVRHTSLVCRGLCTY
jgi:hypothetical protein